MVDFGSDLRKRTLILCAGLALAIAVSVLLRGRRRMNVLFAAFAGDMALWYLAQSFYGIFQASIWARVTALLAVLLPQFAVHLFETILPPVESRRTRLGRVAATLAVPLVLLVLSPYHDSGWTRSLVFFYVGGLLLTSLYFLARRGRNSTSRATQGRVRYLVGVGALATAFSLVDFIWFLGVELPPVGPVLSVIFLFALAQSLGQKRLLPLYELLGRLVVATALSFTLAGIFYVCVTVIGRFSTMYLNAVLAAVVILTLFEPLRQKVEEKIHQIFFRERYGLENAVTKARRRLVHTLELDELRAVVLGALEASRRVTHAALYLSDGTSLVLSGALGGEFPPHVEMATALPLLDRIGRAGSLVLDDIGREAADGGDVPEIDRAGGAALGLDRTGVVLPVRGEGTELLGLLVVRDERVRDAFSPEEVALLESFAAQMSVAFENTRAYGRMKTRDRLADLGQMAAGLAHEIKNPLGAIKGAAQLLAEPASDAAPLDAQAREFVGIILEEVERLDRVVGSVLDYARPAAASTTAVDLNAIVQRTTQILESSEEGAIELQLEDELPRARIDPEKLRQVLINLIQNGLQATSNRGPVVVATRRRTARWGAETDGWLEIAVSDRGPGISKKILKNLFVPFFTTKDTGTGLGLAISQQIIQSAGGSIQVVTVEGEGTTFIILLPPVTEASDARSTPLASAVASASPEEA
ncbi:MAG: GAF domain-containing protein [Myxococcales bacterium]|nr:MAG: GAF domain-containing protein [Myxococcales bacterium]